MERNLAKQVGIYEKAGNATQSSIKAILYFTDDQLLREAAPRDRARTAGGRRDLLDIEAVVAACFRTEPGW